MDEETVKLRLIEAAAQLPGVRAGVDAGAQAQRSVEIAEVWYAWIRGPKGRKKLSLPKKGG